MSEVFSIECGVYSDGSKKSFAVIECTNGTFAICHGGRLLTIPPVAFEPLHNFLRQQIEGGQDAVVSKAGCTTQPSAAEAGKAMPADAPALYDGWNCGNRKLQAQLAIAFIASGRAAARDASDVEYLAEQAGPAFTAAAIQRLIPGFLVEGLTDDDLPF